MQGNGTTVQLAPSGETPLDSQQWDGVREGLLAQLSACYSHILAERSENFGLWQNTRHQVEYVIKDLYRKEGLRRPILLERAFWRNLNPYVPPRDVQAHAELVGALLTDISADFWAHLRRRFEDDGNTHVQFTGGTGLTKSSCALAVADGLAQIDPDNLLGHVAIDIGDLFDKVARLKPGDTIVMDEYLARAGAGSRTMSQAMDNLEDMLRASKVNLFWVSPRMVDSATCQFTLEAIFVARERQVTLFLLWVDGRPLGVVALPWLRKPLWDRYDPWKKGNTERAMHGEFGDTEYTRRMAVQAFERKRFVTYLVEVANKPKKTDFRTALQFFSPRMAASSQVDDMVNFMHDVCYNYERLGPRMQEYFGVDPNEGLEMVAKKCYEE